MTQRWMLRRVLLLLVSAAGTASGKIGSGSVTLRLLAAPQKTVGFVSVSESHYDHTHHTHHHHEETPEPHLAVANHTTKVFLGAAATLDCTVHDLTNESVSWMRQDDDTLTLLTWDNHTYVADDRYQLVAEDGEGWRRWRLVISEVEGRDAGHYRCQVATTPPLVLDAALTVIEPRARVVEERGGSVVEEKHYNSGSMIELQCIIDRVPFPPRQVTWRRGTTILAFNTSRGGISVKTDAAGGTVATRLYVTNSSPKDSGIYSCWYHNYTSASITVHVIAGENSAGLHHDALPDTSSSARPIIQSPLSAYLWLLPCLTTCLNTFITTCLAPTVS
ncbi:hypothetical protein Pcinc_030743 [Petrolisthes cinctipes]|uniref:Ig-like domain-containing protein n=1 Tax=Petrolisthes cinctipes TaxID=88211 RepID=A0AAE1EXS7_PETCI|nr:hypothetical protein Pcinc_030743 [Petrolisthes cinctipes]